MHVKVTVCCYCQKGGSPWTYLLQTSNIQPSSIQMLISGWMFLDVSGLDACWIPYSA